MGDLTGKLRYNRAPTTEFLEVLRGPLAFLLDPKLRVGEHKLDPQLREGNRLQLYTGSTCVLEISYLGNGRVKFAAAGRYGNQHMNGCTGPLLYAPKGAPAEHRSRVQPFAVDSPELEATIRAYLSALSIDSKWLDKESDVQMRARHVGSRDSWWHLDRESVLGGGLDTAPAGKWVAKAWDALLATKEFSTRRPSSPLGLQRAKMQDELDQIGVDAHGKLVLAELKFGGPRSNAAFIYAAPIQLLRYAWAWHVAMNDQITRQGLQRLFEAKRSLFPEFYSGAPAVLGSGIRAVVAFGDPLRQDREVEGKFWAAVACAERFLPESVEPRRIEVWNISQDGVATPAKPGQSYDRLAGPYHALCQNASSTITSDANPPLQP